MPKSSKHLLRLSKLVDDQRKWIADHGLDQAGYVSNYGDPGTGRCEGAGGSAIYAADVTALALSVGQLRKAHGRPGPEIQPEDVIFAVLSASKSSLNPATSPTSDPMAKGRPLAEVLVEDEAMQKEYDFRNGWYTRGKYAARYHDKSPKSVTPDIGS